MSLAYPVLKFVRRPRESVSLIQVTTGFIQQADSMPMNGWKNQRKIFCDCGGHVIILLLGAFRILEREKKPGLFAPQCPT